VKKELLIVTDLGELKAYRVEFTPRRTPAVGAGGGHRVGRRPASVIETVTDMAGRHSGPTQKNWGAPLGDDHNLKLETKRRLIRQIAGHIQRLIERTGSDGCWIAAHKEINQQILEEFLGAQQESAAAQMKDLSHDLRVGEAFDKAFRLMQENAIPALPVVDRLGKLRGLITPENIGELMMMSSLLPKGGQPAWRGLAI
jgi:hypothetical protein